VPQGIRPGRPLEADPPSVGQVLGARPPDSSMPVCPVRAPDGWTVQSIQHARFQVVPGRGYEKIENGAAAWLAGIERL
jgi:hypothetical protein